MTDKGQSVVASAEGAGTPGTASKKGRDKKKMLRKNNAHLKEQNQDLKDKLARMEALVASMGLPSPDEVRSKEETEDEPEEEKTSNSAEDNAFTNITITAHPLSEGDRNVGLLIDTVSITRKKRKHGKGKKKTNKRKKKKPGKTRSRKHHHKKKKGSSSSATQVITGEDGVEMESQQYKASKNARRKQARKAVVGNQVTFTATTEMPEQALLGHAADDQSYMASDSLEALKKKIYNKLVGLNYAPITKVSSTDKINKLLQDELTKGKRSAFYLFNLSSIVEKYVQWKALLPRIEPHYAMKCNPDPMTIRTLHALGIGFDCASKKELELVLEAGVEAKDIIFANPCKQEEHIDYAKEQGIKLMTFDSHEELLKVHERFPEAELVLRILPDDTHSLMPFGTKFGAGPAEVSHLLAESKRLGVKLVGVSFHVGSGCYSASAYTDAVRLAKDVFDEALDDYGIKMDLLDIGGGYPGYDPVAPDYGSDDSDSDSDSDREGSSSGYGHRRSPSDASADHGGGHLSFADIAAVMGPMVDELFPIGQVRVISEPGRFFVTTAATLAVNVVCRRERVRGYLKENRVAGAGASAPVPQQQQQQQQQQPPRSPEQEADVDQFCQRHSDDESASDTEKAGGQQALEEMTKEVLYYLSDGVYGSFNNIIFDHATPAPELLATAEGPNAPKQKSCLFGPTCDSIDVIAKGVELPRLNVGDWLYFVNMGAYTTASASNFNGIRPPQYHYIMSMDHCIE